MPVDQIQYSERYNDDIYEYRHVILPPDIARLVPKSHLMTETEWRNLGVQQSPGWLHFMVHNPEPHVLLFRRLRTDVPAPLNGLDLGNNSSVKVLVKGLCN
ncbi:cyclin-dependent kinases regulatory subunit-like [Pararge aegeria]|uniref:Cyclin-dependent kinases regulatory subunit n=2 Tax=Pararge aegeria TaxID=116150 RepID=A0A8S4QYF5_9NEOP|nr:cyclin-dependent kinases regulatory subunit-like [Pararge aegeria]CAH2227205.1 jg14609 [Pararge aegeria aegeria]